MIPILLLTAIPYFFVRLQQSNRLFTWARERTPLERKAWYVNMLLTQATAAKEVRLSTSALGYSKVPRRAIGAASERLL